MVKGHYDSVDISLKTSKEIKVYAEKLYIVQAKVFDIEAGKNIIVLNEQESREMSIYPGNRVIVKKGDKEAVAIVDVSQSVIARGFVGIFEEVRKAIDIKDGDLLEIRHMPIPTSIEGIIKKINGAKLSDAELKAYVRDIVDNKLAEPEIAAFLVAAQIRGLDDDEIIGLIEGMVSSGGQISFDSKYVVDKHCIGGVAANRTTMVVVPIIAAAGALMPKTSSRAITSPAGTADTMEVLAPVEFSLEELERITKKVGGAIVWGGGVNIAPADDKMIAIRRPLRLDPLGVMMASILAKKKAVGSKHLIIDIPIGRGAKVEDIEEGRTMGEKFKTVATRLGINTAVIITDGSEPIGNGIGPALEARDVLSVLEGKGPTDLKEKAILIAGTLLELCGKAKLGEGIAMAESILNSGKALKKMKEIIEAQGGNPNIKSEDIKIGDVSIDIIAEKDGRIEHIDNKGISRIARIAGAPMDKGAGIYLWKAKGDVVKKGDKIMTIYSHNEERLTLALKSFETMSPISMEKLLLTKI
ncbi:MAG: AMP phosphorylase [Candidatus Anstonellales archaeon]